MDSYKCVDSLCWIFLLQDGEGHVMMSDGIPVTEGPLDGTGVGGVLSASPLMVPEAIAGDPIATDSIGEAATH